MPAPVGAVLPQDAVIFDLDGATADSAAVQAHAGKQLVAEVLADDRTASIGGPAPAGAGAAESRNRDTRTPEDAVSAFLAARGGAPG